MDCSELDSESDSDLIGIGVRTSIYIQALLPLFLEITTLVVTRGRPGASPHKAVVKAGLLSSASILVTGYAVIFSAIIQAKTRHLASSHALLTLNLNWLISLASTDVFYFFGDILPGPLAPNPEPSQQKTSRRSSLRIACFLVFLATGLHLACTSAFGVWFFSSPQVFTPETRSCTPTTVLSIFGIDFRALDPSFRNTWLVIYAVFLLPLLNVILVHYLIFFVWLFAVHIWWNGARFLFLVWRTRRNTRALPTSNTIREVWSQYRNGWFQNVYPPSMVISFTLTKLLIIILTELTIRRNNLQAVVGKWTFVQTLVLFLTLPIVWKSLHDALAARRYYNEECKSGSCAGGNPVHSRIQTQLPWPLEKGSTPSLQHKINLNTAQETYAQSEDSDVELDEWDKKRGLA